MFFATSIGSSSYSLTLQIDTRPNKWIGKLTNILVREGYICQILLNENVN